MRTVFLLLSAVVAGSAPDSPVTRVVTLLQEMLENSKSDGTADRLAYAKFKCYCDKETDEKTHDILNATGEIERMETTIAKARASNAKLSQEVFELQQAIDDNRDAQGQADNTRGKERTQFKLDRDDMVTGIAQLEDAIKLLSAVGADQSEPNELTNSDNTVAMGGQGATSDGVGDAFLQKSRSLTLPSEAKAALRAASVFLTSSQRKAVSSFLQAPGNYNAQSGEIVGLLKNMNDTFTANLATAKDDEFKARAAYTTFTTNSDKEHTDFGKSKLSKKTLIGTAASTISTTNSQRINKEGEKKDNEDFLAALTTRCETKKAEFDKRNMLRTGEEAAIAQAVSILDSDDSFGVFAGTGAKGMASVPAGFLQMSAVIHKKSRVNAERVLRAKVIKSLLATAKETHSLRLARTIASLAAVNPFEQVVAQIRGVIELIDKEGAADLNKKNWCVSEQGDKGNTKGDLETDIGTLRTNIGNLQTAVDESTTNIEQAEEDITSNRAAQATETDNRKAAHDAFQANLKNLQDAKSILNKAIEVLDKYYDFLHASTASPSWRKVASKDSGGGNLEQVGGNPDVADLKKACGARPDCLGFNTAGWLKGSIADEAEWYQWDGGDLWIKQIGERDDFLQAEPSYGAAGAVQAGPTMSTGGEKGNAAIEMLEFIRDETKTEADAAIDSEKTNQMQFETNMKALSTAEDGLDTAIQNYKTDKATSAKRLQENKEDKRATADELKTTETYLAEIKPGCTFMRANIGARQAAQSKEKTALEGAITTLETSAAYTNYADDQESEDLGECSEICEGKKTTMTAKCQACINEVTVFGYCAQAKNAAKVGTTCDDPTATGSADEMNAPTEEPVGGF